MARERSRELHTARSTLARALVTLAEAEGPAQGRPLMAGYGLDEDNDDPDPLTHLARLDVIDAARWLLRLVLTDAERATLAAELDGRALASHARRLLDPPVYGLDEAPKAREVRPRPLSDPTDRYHLQRGPRL